MSQLLPCPFCGKSVHINRFRSDKAPLSYLMHDEQEGCPLVATANYPSDEAAITAWNRRSP